MKPNGSSNVTLAEYKEKKNLTYKALSDAFDTTIDKVFRWSRDGAIVKKVNGKREEKMHQIGHHGNHRQDFGREDSLA